MWVIIRMVCSYFRDVSFSRAMTSLVFWVSRLPVGSSAKIDVYKRQDLEGATNYMEKLLKAIIMCVLFSTVCEGIVRQHRTIPSL